jgi:hypothetical protein
VHTSNSIELMHNKHAARLHLRRLCSLSVGFATIDRIPQINSVKTASGVIFSFMSAKVICYLDLLLCMLNFVATPLACSRSSRLHVLYFSKSRYGHKRQTSQDFLCFHEPIKSPYLYLLSQKVAPVLLLLRPQRLLPLPLPLLNIRG